MPGNVVIASPTLVFPFSLCKSYSRTKTWDMRVNWLVDGRNVRQPYGKSDRSVWALSQRLSPALWGTLYTFYRSVRGGTDPFYFYDLYESGFHYDAAGAQTLGRYPAIFQGGLTTTVNVARHDLQFSIIQIA